MEESKQLCKNCRRSIAASNFVIHTLHCERKLKLCQLCKEPVPRSEFDKHLDENHNLEDCPFCKVPLEKCQLELHQEEECPQMPVSCKYCKKKYPRKEIVEHDLVCGSRTEECPFCGQYVLYQDKENHSLSCRKDLKNKSLASCNYCELEFPSQEYPDHEKNCGSRTEMCDLCDQFVMLKDKFDHAGMCKKVESEQDMLFCDHCKSGFNWRNYHDHVLNCKYRPVKCPFCECFVKFEEIEIHDCICQQRFSERESVVDSKQDIELDENPVTCSYCDVDFPLDCLHEHMETCKDITEECQNCKSHISFKDKNKHKEICNSGSEAFFSLCKHCKVKFRFDAIELHEKNCIDRIGTCLRCKNSVMIRDRVKHKESCVSKESEQAPCPVCQDLIPSDKLERHFNACVESNAHYLQTQTKKESFNEPESMVYTECSQSLIQENEWRNERNTKSCPYCSESIPEKRFHNHKKFCTKAFKICPLCEFTFHVEEEAEHSTSCDVIKNIESEKRISYSAQNEYNLRKYETDFKSCYYCVSKIPIDSYPSHTKQCAQGLKKCSFCKETYHKDKETAHLIRCVPSRQIKPDQYIYEAFQDEKDRSQINKTSSIKDPRICPKCNIEVPSLCFNNHILECNPTYQPCIHCGKHIHVNDVEHEKNCLTKKNRGAKPKKNSKKENKPNIISRLMHGVKDSLGFSDSPYTTYDSSYNYPNREILIPPQPSAPVEDTLIPCEFCNKLVPIENLTIHETGCKPDFTSLPTAAANQSNRTTSSHDIKESQRQYITLSDDTLNKDDLLDMRFGHEEKGFGPKITIIQENSRRNEDEVRKEYEDNFNFFQNLNPKHNTRNMLLDEEEIGKTTINKKENQNACVGREVEKHYKEKDQTHRVEKIENAENFKDTLNYAFSGNQNANGQRLVEIYNQEKIQNAGKRYENSKNKKTSLDVKNDQKDCERAEENYNEQENPSLKGEKISKNSMNDQTVMYSEGNPSICQQSKNIEKRNYENIKTGKSVLFDDGNMGNEDPSLEYIYSQKRIILQEMENEYEDDNPANNQNSYKLRSGQIYCREDVSPKAKISKKLETENQQENWSEILQKNVNYSLISNIKCLEELTNSAQADQSIKHTKPGEFLECDYYQQLQYHHNDAYDSTENFGTKEVIKKALKVKSTSEKEALCHMWQALEADKDFNDKKLNKELTKNTTKNHEKISENTTRNNYKQDDVVNDHLNFKLIDFQDEPNTLFTDVKNKFDTDYSQPMPSSFSQKQNVRISESKIKVVAPIESEDSCIISSSEMRGAIKIDRLRWGKLSPIVEQHQKKPDLNIKDEEIYSNKHNLNINSYGKAASGSDICYKNEYPYIKENLQEKFSIYNRDKKEDQLKIEYENFQSNEQAMEVDENYIPPMSRENFYTKLNDLSSICNVSPEPPNIKEKETQNSPAVKERGCEFNVFSDSKERDMNEYYQKLLDIEEDKNSRTWSCKVCGNEICLCEIKRSLLTSRSYSFSEDPKNEDFLTYQEKTSKTENREKERLQKVEHETWKKYREHLDSD